MLKTKDELEKELGLITERDKEKIESILNILKEIYEQKQLKVELINRILDSSQLLANLYKDLSTRYIRILSQNHLIS